METVRRATAAGQRLLLCAPSNMAVDLLALRLASADPSLRLVRFGNPERIDVRALNISVDELADAWLHLGLDKGLPRDRPAKPGSKGGGSGGATMAVAVCRRMMPSRTSDYSLAVRLVLVAAMVSLLLTPRASVSCTHRAGCCCRRSKGRQACPLRGLEAHTD